MRSGPDDPVVPTWIEAFGGPEDAPADRSASDSVAHDTPEVPVVTELGGASSQSPRPVKNDAAGIKSHENTKVDDTEADTATVTGKEQDSAKVVATEVQTVKADKQNPQLDPETMIKQLETRPISQDQLVAEVKGIYAGLLMVESKCIEVDNGQMPPEDGPLDVTKYLYIKAQKDATKEDKKPSTPESTKNLPATSQDLSATPGDSSTTPEEDSAHLPAHSDVSGKTAPLVGSPEDYLRAFRVALELYAKADGWPEYEQLAAVNAAEIDEDDRKKVIDGKYYLDIGNHLVNQLLRDLETAKTKAAEKEAEAKAKADQEAAQAKAEEEASQAKEDKKDSNPDLGATSAQPQASTKEVGSAPGDSGKATVDAAVDAVDLDEKKPKTKLPIFVDLRPLDDEDRYRKVGREWWVLISGRWIPSLSAEHYAALVALHRRCLDEHYDFFLASQHPSASPAISGLAVEYAMPARLWKHAIHAFLEVLRYRLPESQETMDHFIIMAYGMMASLEETVPRFRFTWIECKADLARYGMAIQEEDKKVQERWRDTAKEEYTQVVIDDPTVGRLYHHLAILVRARSSSPDAIFEANVSKLFYYTKSLIVKTPFYTARDSVLTVVNPIVDRNKKAAEEPASVPQTDQDHFLTAVAHLILASLEPEILRKNGHKDSRKDHIQAVYAALERIKVGEPLKTPRIRPSAKLGLLLCQLLLGIPPVDKRWSPMVAAWAPDLVTAEDRADSDAMANARDIHDATIELISTMVPYLLEDADTRDLRVWEFIYVILVFMRSLKTRPALLNWLGSAFHAEVIAPYLNMLLREDETRGRHAFESASQSELVTVCSPLNEKTKLGNYGLSTEDNIRNYLREQEEKRKAESAEITVTAGEVTAEETMATTEETTTSDTAHEMDGHTKTPGSEPLHANVLPEHFELSGLFFAKEADPEPRGKPLENPTADAVVGGCPTAPEATPAAAQTIEEPAVRHAQEVSLADSETYSQSGDGVLTDPEPEHEAMDENLENPVPKSEIEAQEKQQTEREAVEASLAEVERKEREAKEEEERKRREAKEAEEAEVRRQEGLLRDPPLFPNGWLKKSKYDFDEIRVCDYVQSFETYNDRSNQILRLAVQLFGIFFIFESDGEKRIWISVSGASSVPKPDPNKKMPKIVERDGGVRVVYVDPSSHAAELKKKEKLAREEERRKEKEMEKNAEATTEVATVFDEKAKGERPTDHVNAEGATEAVNIPAGAPARKAARALKAELTEDVLNQMPKVEKPANAIERWRAPIKTPGADKHVDEDGWTHVSDESYGDAETGPTVQMVQVETRSMISRLFWRREE
ncbi:uncharacterized protein B0I36DRAFT_417372 [Microdochium trichocladiopsis]|uniref:DNA/RNA-binding domain-containing protein n=1 Tax=Microdochium trichocladiopsis TaxID=1682393 RepID=A0A9P8XYP7_9PEZI|nr:uncharacterized protein B0I36DRAFT_417372 [Microdochium trichocladiopsis]KAH7025232.1 hypothetical protein B0I36DRAFT_417372 [Microdochium trichocladiopsis]